MSGKFEYLDHTADIAVKVTADSIEDLFIAASDALKDSLAENIKQESAETKRINLNEYSSEELLVSFLNELNYLFSVKKWLLNSVISISIDKYEKVWRLKTECQGSKASCVYKEEIKAVTFHRMEIKSENGKFSCILVFDI